MIVLSVYTSGLLEQVLTGKRYSRAIRVHKLKLEALGRLLFAEFIAHAFVDNYQPYDAAIASKQHLAESPDHSL